MRRLQEGESALDVASLDDWDDAAVDASRWLSASEPGIPASANARWRLASSVSEPTASEASSAARHRGGRAGGDRTGRGPPCSRSSSSSRSPGSRRCATSSRREYEARSAASCSRRSPAATGSRPIPTSRPTSSASCSRVSTPASRGRRSRRSRSSPTSSRSPAARCRRSAASTSRRRSPRCCSAATCRRSGATPAPAPRCSTAPPASSSSGSAWPRSTTSRRWATSCPTPSVVEALERGLRISDDPHEAGRRRRRRGRGGRRRQPLVRLTRSCPSDRTASGCRRSWRAPASARAGCARS